MVNVVLVILEIFLFYYSIFRYIIFSVNCKIPFEKMIVGIIGLDNFLLLGIQLLFTFLLAVNKRRIYFY